MVEGGGGREAGFGGDGDDAERRFKLRSAVRRDGQADVRRACAAVVSVAQKSRRPTSEGGVRWVELW